MLGNLTMEDINLAQLQWIKFDQSLWLIVNILQKFKVAWVYFMTMIVSWGSILAFVISKILLIIISFQHYCKAPVILHFIVNFREGGCDSGVDSTLNFIRSSFWITRADEQWKSY